MNMSEDVTAVSMQVSEKAAEAALSAFKSVLDSVGRLFRELLGMEHDRARAKAQMKVAKGGAQTPEKTKPPNVSATNLTGIKPGEVSLKDLAENARITGEALSVVQNGFSQEDRKAIARTAKKYGIPVAFSNTKGKNNLYANVRSGDLPIFKQICTECVKEKIATQPETLGNFKVQPWEVPHLTAMLKEHDLPAVFVETKSGDQYCLHDVKHQDANGKPVRGEDGKTAWSALKADMLEASGMDKDAVLTFRSQEEYEQYLADTEMLRDADELPEAENISAHGNGHELHPEGNVLNELHTETPVSDAKSDLPVPDAPEIPDMPKPAPRGARR